LTLAGLISAVGVAAAFGVASLSGPSENEPRSNEQPPSEIASSAAGATQRAILKTAFGVESAMQPATSRVA
jgi:hypothetical protein